MHFKRGGERPVACESRSRLPGSPHRVMGRQLVDGPVGGVRRHHLPEVAAGPPDARPQVGHSTAGTRADQRRTFEHSDIVHRHSTYTQYTAHSTQHTAHSTPHTAHSTQYAAHSTQHTASRRLPDRLAVSLSALSRVCPPYELPVPPKLLAARSVVYTASRRLPDRLAASLSALSARVCPPYELPVPPKLLAARSVVSVAPVPA